MENASVYCRYCGAHPNNWHREQCESREVPDARTAREHAETVRKAHADAMMALAADVHPYSASAVRQHEQAMDAALDALLAQVERLEQERDDAIKYGRADWKVYEDIRDRADAAEARAQRYREALEFYAAPNFDGGMVARRALACDPLVCRDPNLCWGTGTCPRDPACNE